ncbi:hypothetical protein KUCAC02_020494, partial [Chaenocephalus aceratus]
GRDMLCHMKPSMPGLPGMLAALPTVVAHGIGQWTGRQQSRDISCLRSSAVGFPAQTCRGIFTGPLGEGNGRFQTSVCPRPERPSWGSPFRERVNSSERLLPARPADEPTHTRPSTLHPTLHLPYTPMH